MWMQTTAGEQYIYDQALFQHIDLATVNQQRAMAPVNAQILMASKAKG
jgi:hypothetical protein